MDNHDTTNIIEVRDLHVTYRVRKKNKANKKESTEVRAIDGVTFNIREGEILAAVGESGCGKTSLGKAILKIIPSTGEILFAGRDLNHLNKRELQGLRKDFQLIYQDPYESLDPGQSVYKIMEEPLLIHRPELSKQERTKLIFQALESVGLQPPEVIAKNYPHHLSGGQRQRLSIAASMILEPAFVVADEPVSMLDVSVRSEILKVMLDLKASKKLTYLFISHDLSLTWMIADRIAVFYLGKLVEIGDANEIVHHSLHPYTRALVSVIPAMAGAKRAEEEHLLNGETPSPTAVPPGCRFHTRCWFYQQHGCPGICTEREPEMRDCGNGHYVACHFDKEGNPYV